jgi:hypothetical protein
MHDVQRFIDPIIFSGKKITPRIMSFEFHHNMRLHNLIAKLLEC